MANLLEIQRWVFYKNLATSSSAIYKYIYILTVPFSNHSTLNFSICRYMYGDTEVALLQKSCNIEFRYIYVYINILTVPFSNHATSNYSIYRYIYIITVLLWPL